MTSEKLFQIAVVGDGPVGNTAILMAAKLGLNTVHIVPPQPVRPPSVVPRTYAIAPKVQARLADLGVWGLLGESQIQPTQHMNVFWQTREGDVALPLSAYEGCVPQLCAFVAEDDLAHAIDVAVKVTASTRVLCPQWVQSVQHHSDHVQLTMSSGQVIRAELLIVADGAQSKTRTLLGLAPTVYDYQHSAVVTVVYAAKPHASTAWQWLGQDSSVLALLPMPPDPAYPHRGRYGLVWSQDNTCAQGYVEQPQRLLNDLNTRCAAAVGAIEIGSGVQSFALFQSLCQDNPHPHTVLVGDAAHRIHPLAGQGLNVGLEDVFALETVLSQRVWRRCNDPRLLARYRRLRAVPMAQMTRLVHAIATRKQWPDVAQKLAGQGLAFVQAKPRLGQWFRRKIVSLAVKGAS